MPVRVVFQKNLRKSRRAARAPRRFAGVPESRNATPIPGFLSESEIFAFFFQNGRFISFLVRLFTIIVLAIALHVCRTLNALIQLKNITIRYLFLNTTTKNHTYYTFYLYNILLADRCFTRINRFLVDTP